MLWGGDVSLDNLSAWVVEGLTPLVVRGSSRSMWEPNWPGWLLTASALREADMISGYD